MWNSRTLKSLFRSPIWAACLGAILFGGITLAVDYGDYYFGPKSGHGSWGIFLVLLIGAPAHLFIQATGVTNTRAFQYLFAAIGGFGVGALFNAVFGALCFGAYAYARKVTAPRES